MSYDQGLLDQLLEQTNQPIFFSDLSSLMNCHFDKAHVFGQNAAPLITRVTSELPALASSSTGMAELKPF